MGGQVCASGDRTPMQPRTFFKRRARELREDMPTPIQHGWNSASRALTKDWFFAKELQGASTLFRA